MAWQGKVLRVNLTQGSSAVEPLNMEWAAQYLGARGLGTKYLSESMDPKVDPLSPENVLIFATGPLTGTLASTSGRYVVVTKGALTNAIGCSNSGGKWGPELKFAGFDLLILEGCSPHPVYLLIEDDHVQLLPADDIWGGSVWHADAWIKERHANPQIKIAAIGEAGERQVRFACIVNDLHRAAGRCGVGAVMGSKNLKAVAVRGTQGVKVKDPVRFMAVMKETHAQLKNDAGRRELSELGTNAMIDVQQAFGGLPTRNFNEVQFEGTDKINPAAMWATKPNGHRNMITNKACFGCTIACGRISHIDKEHFTVVNRRQYIHASGGLEYENAFSLGSVVGVDDLDAATYANFLCNEHGMDPISFGVTLAAAMEMFEMGVLTLADTDGIALNFGNAEALAVMVEKTGKHEGFGKILGLGSKRMCEKYGHPELFMGVKGQEFAGYDSRALQGMGLGYATGNRGACHLKHASSSADMDDQTGQGKARVIKDSQDHIAALDSTGLCLFPADAGWSPQSYADMLDAACIGNWSVDAMNEVGERIWNLERLFNEKAGFTMADDTLPDRMLKTPCPSGVAKGKVNELSRMLPEYYALRGWTEDGMLPKQLRDRLGI